MNKQLAANLDITEKTVKVHRPHALEKLELRSVVEGLRLFERLRWLPPQGAKG